MKPAADLEGTARERLLAAGVPLLDELRGRHIAAVGTREIARLAGVSWVTFFHNFKDLREYTEALSAYVAAGFDSDRASA